ncbi:hypothetical protein B0H14DRAFT_2901053 [Mycena olivaceomarginata]|nr:hypothetical protein B0H14DRAFT_2901053 [Mycena olivaceomarginata]
MSKREKHRGTSFGGWRQFFGHWRSQSDSTWTTNRKDTTVSPLHALTEDSSAKFWSVYISEAEHYDSALVESWKADMEGMLIFSGLFSASLTAFIIESYKSLVPDTGNMTVDLLSQLSQQLNAQFNGSHFTVSSSPPFMAPTSALFCNGLWFVSLGLSLTCALLATLVEQWAREFLHKTERVHSPVRRARVFSFLYYGVSRFGIHAIVDIIPLLLHLGLVLFFAGLAVFLLPINSIMAGIVTSVLVLFLALYLVITALPIISLDCPYRTPLSAMFWRVVQYTAMFFHFPSTGSNLTDAVLAAAMQRRNIRDERAVLWTLEALTDNTELLPFVEATHEIIGGPTGLRRVDDHLFRLVLQTADAHTSLPRRILSLLWSAETLPLQDPLRERRQLAGFRALWALASEVFGIGRGSLHALSIPVAYRLSLDAVISYVHLKSIQARFEDIRTLFAARDLSLPRDRRRVVRFLRATVLGLEHDCKRARITLQVHSLLEPLAPPQTSQWPLHFAKIVLRLVGAAFDDGVAPYMLSETCKEILPDISAVPARLLPLPYSLFNNSPEALPASLHAMLGDPAQNDLDVMMRCGLRLLPLVDHKSFMPIVHWYLADRAGDLNWQYALGECSLDILARAIMVDIGGKDPTLVDQRTLGGIVSLCLWSRNFMELLDCERILDIVDRADTALAACSTAKAVLCARILVALRSKIQARSAELGEPRHGPPDLGMLQEIAVHPLLHEEHGPGTNDVSPSFTELHDRLVRRLSDRYATQFIRFLSACASPLEPPYKTAATIRYLRREWEPFLDGTRMSTSVQLELAQVVLTLVKCHQNHPTRADLHTIVQCLFDDLDPDGKLSANITDSQSVAILAEAIGLYHGATDPRQPHNPLPSPLLGRRPGRSFSLDVGSLHSPLAGSPGPWRD